MGSIHDYGPETTLNRQLYITIDSKALGDIMSKTLCSMVLITMLAISGCWTVSNRSDNNPPPITVSLPAQSNEHYDRARIGHDIAAPTVHLIINEVGGGTGVVIGETKDGSIIITANHVVRKAKTIRAEQTINGHTNYGFGLEIIAHDDLKDMAILSCPRKWAGVAQIIAKVTDLENFMEAFTYGYPGSGLGQLDGILSHGFISNTAERRFSLDRVVTSTSVPVTKGNSGGGLFVLVDGHWKLAGIADFVLVQRYDDQFQMVNIISAFVSAEDMLDFIARSK